MTVKWDLIEREPIHRYTESYDTYEITLSIEAAGERREWECAIISGDSDLLLYRSGYSTLPGSMLSAEKALADWHKMAEGM